MKSSIGNNIQISLFGESHGSAIGLVVDGLAPGIHIDYDFIYHQMDLRKPKGNISTQRKEADEIKILSGVFNGFTTGTPLCICIENQSQHSKDYEQLRFLPRPSHADFTAYEKYFGYQDYRGGGHFSGRLTAPLVALGAICISMLKQKGIIIGSHLVQIEKIQDQPFSDDLELCQKQIEKMNDTYFAVLDSEIEKKMLNKIEEARLCEDSVGGIVETMILNVPAGIGEPYFHSIESVFSHYLFSIGAVKGVEFGLGFDFACKKGSECNDAFRILNGHVITETNNNGGINGGISNGMPIQIRCAIKPTPSIYQTQNSVNLKTMENTELKIEGRHDPCIVHRARIVIDSVVAIALVDLLQERYGIQYFAGEKR